MKPRPIRQRFLPIDELSPIIDAASCWKVEQRIWFRYRLPLHHLMLIESGRIEARTPKGTIHGGPGDLMCFRPVEWHEYGICSPLLVYQCGIRFAPPPRQRYTPNLDEYGPLPYRVEVGKAFEEMRRVFETICIEVPQAGATHRLRQRAAVFEMLAIISGVLMRDRGGGKHLDPWQRVKIRLESELTSDIMVKTLARQMNLTASYFNRVFKQRFGVSPKAYHTHARLQEAARLLRSTDMSIKALAYGMGFRNPKVFARLFKSHLGVLPSDIRADAPPGNPGSPATPKTPESPESPGATGSGRLFPMNTNLVPPPHTSDSRRKKYLPRRHDILRDIQWKSW